jgi:hypothetical protein
MPASKETRVPADIILDDIRASIRSAAEDSGCAVKGAVVILTYENEDGDQEFARFLRLGRGTTPKDIEALQKQYQKGEKLFTILDKKISKHAPQGHVFDTGEIRVRLDNETGKSYVFNSLDQESSFREDDGPATGDDVSAWD